MKNVEILKNNGVEVEKALELFGDMEMYDSTLEDFLAGIGEKVENIKKYKEAADMANYAIYAHSIKSDARYLGFVKLADLSYQHEMNSKSNNVLFVYEHYDEYLTEIDRILKVVNEYMGKETTSIVKEEVEVKKDKTILVVDDSDLVSNFIKKIFNNTFEILVARDGAEAIKILEQEPEVKIDAALIDLNMPNVNGYQLLEYFREHNLFVKIPVSIITGNDDRTSVEKSFSYPIIDLLSKPFNERDIKAFVEKTIGFYN